jgi:hypothetical protein
MDVTFDKGGAPKSRRRRRNSLRRGVGATSGMANLDFQHWNKMNLLLL